MTDAQKARINETMDELAALAAALVQRSGGKPPPDMLAALVQLHIAKHYGRKQ